jgi:AcrR family transcriptional regulator
LSVYFRRRDAVRNRQALVASFMELLASDGADVPLYRVAQRAGVGQATLYRHFPERGLLALAVYEQRLQHLHDLAALRAADPRAFLQLIEELILEETRMPGLLRVLRAGAHGEHYLQDLRQRVLGLLTDPLEAARAAGIVRATVQLDDVPIILAMLEGPVEEAATSGRPEVALRALALVFQGIAQRGRRRGKTAQH